MTCIYSISPMPSPQSTHPGRNSFSSFDSSEGQQLRVFGRRMFENLHLEWIDFCDSDTGNDSGCPSQVSRTSSPVFCAMCTKILSLAEGSADYEQRKACPFISLTYSVYPHWPLTFVRPPINARLVGFQWRNLDSPRCGWCAKLKPPQQQYRIAESSEFVFSINYLSNIDRNLVRIALEVAYRATRSYSIG